MRIRASGGFSNGVKGRQVKRLHNVVAHGQLRGRAGFVLTILTMIGLTLASCSGVRQGVLESLPTSAPPPTSGTSYYVSPDGHDTNSGRSESEPWQTIDRVNQADLEPGDSVLFEGGKTFFGSLLLDSDDQGTVQNPITIGSYGSGRATISSGDKIGVNAYNVSGIEVRELNVVGSGRRSNGVTGIRFYTDLPNDQKLEHVRIDWVEVSGYGSAGITIGSWHGLTGFKDVRITHVVVHDNGSGGITSWGYFPVADGWPHQDIYVGYAKAYNNPGVPGNPKQSGSGIVLGNVDGAVVEHSEAHHNGWLNERCGGPVGIWAWDANRVTIQHNESHHNSTGSGKCDGGGFDLDGGVTNSVMQYNYSHDNDGPGFLIAQFDDARAMRNVTVRYNVSINDGRQNNNAGLVVRAAKKNPHGIQGADIYNNTIYVDRRIGGQRAALVIDSHDISQLRVCNNIFIAAGGTALLHLLSGDALFQSNTYWSPAGLFLIRWGTQTFSSLSRWRASTGQEQTGDRSPGFHAVPWPTIPCQGGVPENRESVSQSARQQPRVVFQHMLRNTPR